MKKMKQFHTWVVEQVLWAEKELKGKTGKEKRAIIVQKLDDMIQLPWYLEAFDGPAIGLAVDKVCDKLNLLTDDDFSGVTLTAAQEDQMAQIAELPEAVVKAATGANFQERFDNLCAKYGITADESAKQ